MMVIAPQHPLAPLSDLRPANTITLGFIVTRGFRNASPIDTGTRDVVGNWGSPDDLVYAYKHLLKQTSDKASNAARHLFVTEADFRHYASPWSVFPNGEAFLTMASPNFVNLAKKDGRWPISKNVSMFFGDRWDTGPAGLLFYSWPELVAFDEYLAAHNLPRLTGKTRAHNCAVK